ncbi:hypothetical protein ACFPOI_09990 [Nonomuraea angiospora]|uniref:Integrase n=1 Tax=Nonomuraea angiospora TaxID=46172 RepID=A0ABR9M9X3_9ACTN|nr:hypothetical protein [Nonomuraea angiospora]MBE1589700.1 hypothetical protein [Nonomuraea angiospora]
MDRTAPHTFSTKKDAEIWLTNKEAELLAGDWLDPPLGKVAKSAARRGSMSARGRGGSRPEVAKAYRLLKAIFNTAVEDRLIKADRGPVVGRKVAVARSTARALGAAEAVLWSSLTPSSG